MDRKLRLQHGIRNLKDAYIDYAERLLEKHPEYWSKYKSKTPHYNIFKHEGFKVVEVMSYDRYKEIILTWFKKARKYVIEGQTLVLGSGLGKIAGRRVERNFNKKVIDWEQTNALWKETGVRKGHVYRVDPDWARIGWKKTRRLKNCYLYRFTPMGNNKNKPGFKGQFSFANKMNPLLKYRYQFFPYIKQDTK